jgi:hypothetical protein
LFSDESEKFLARGYAMGGLFNRRHLLAGGVSILASRAFGAEKEPVGMQLILAADVSCSVNTERYAVQQQGYVRALQDSRVMQAIRNLDPPVLGITFVVWAGNQTTLVQWTRVHDPQSMRSFCAALQASRRPSALGCQTFIAQALVYADAQFDAVFHGGRKVIDISGDGEDSSKQIQLLRDTRDLLVARGVTINGLPIIVRPPEYIRPPQPPEGLEVYYRNHVVGGPGHVVVESAGFENFEQAILQKLLLEIA